MKFQDVLAGAMAFVLLLAIIALVMLERAIPDVLTGAFGIATGWVFSRSINGQVRTIQRKAENGESGNRSNPV